MHKQLREIERESLRGRPVRARKRGYRRAGNECGGGGAKRNAYMFTSVFFTLLARGEKNGNIGMNSHKKKGTGAGRNL